MGLFPRGKDIIEKNLAIAVNLMYLQLIVYTQLHYKMYRYVIDCNKKTMIQNNFLISFIRFTKSYMHKLE